MPHRHPAPLPPIHNPVAVGHDRYIYIYYIYIYIYIYIYRNIFKYIPVVSNRYPVRNERVKERVQVRVRILCLVLRQPLFVAQRCLIPAQYEFNQ